MYYLSEFKTILHNCKLLHKNKKRSLFHLWKLERALRGLEWRIIFVSGEMTKRGKLERSISEKISPSSREIRISPIKAGSALSTLVPHKRR